MDDEPQVGDEPQVDDEPLVGDAPRCLKRPSSVLSQPGRGLNHQKGGIGRKRLELEGKIPKRIPERKRLDAHKQPKHEKEEKHHKQPKPKHAQRQEHSNDVQEQGVSSDRSSN